MKVVKKLSELKIGDSGVITSVVGDGRVRHRMFDMGVTPGATVYLRKTAPLGDPIEVTLRNYELTLRKTEAELVMVEVEEEEEEA